MTLGSYILCIGGYFCSVCGFIYCGPLSFSFSPCFSLPLSSPFSLLTFILPYVFLATVLLSSNSVLSTTKACFRHWTYLCNVRASLVHSPVLSDNLHMYRTLLSTDVRSRTPASPRRAPALTLNRKKTIHYWFFLDKLISLAVHVLRVSEVVGYWSCWLLI